jgi:glycosyl transferase, family 25
MQICYRVISLAGSLDRRGAMQAQFAQLLPDIDWAFFDACDSVPDFLSHDPGRTRRRLRRDMSRGELGCFASHASLWRWWATQPREQALVVLEDDVVLDPHFFASLPVYLEALPGAEFLRLYAKAPTPAKVIRPIMGKHVIRYLGIAYGTQAYVIRPSAAAKFVRSIQSITRPVDDEMDRYWVHDVRNYALYPFPVMELSAASTIGQSRRRIDTSLKAHLIWKAYRAANALARHWCNFRLSLLPERL